jgi:hypothetical protein
MILKCSPEYRLALVRDLDQIDLPAVRGALAPPQSTHRIYAKSRDPVRGVIGRIMPDATLAEAPQWTSACPAGGRQL